MFIFEAISQDLSIWEVKKQIQGIILELVGKKNEHNETPLIVASKVKNLTWVDFLLSLGSDPKEMNSGRQNALQLLINKDTPLTLISAFLELGVDPNHQDQDGQSALSYALKYQHQELTQLLLSEGANPNLLDKNGNSPLLLAALVGNVHNLEILLESGINLDSKNSLGQNALHMATISGSEEIIKRLIEAGILKNEKDNFGRNALHYSAVMDNPELTEILIIAGVNPNAPDKEGLAPLAMAASQGLPDQVEVLLKFGADPNRADLKNETTLVRALKQGPLNYSQIFKAEKPEEDSAIRIKGTTNDFSFMNEAIMVRGSALEKKHLDYFRVKSLDANSLNQYAEVAALLLKAGSTINFENDIKKNPVILDAIKQNEQLVKTLMDYEKQKALGQFSTPEITIPVVQELNRKETVEKAFVSSSCIDKLGETDESNKIENSKRIPVNGKNADGVPYLIAYTLERKHEVVEQLIKEGHDCSVRNKLGLTALMVASALGDLETVNILLKYDPNVNSKNVRGENALLMAIIKNEQKVALALLKAGANPDVRYKGAYFLHFIAENGATELAQLMLKYGANPGVKDIKGRTPAQYAKAKGFKNLEAILGGPKEN